MDHPGEKESMGRVTYRTRVHPRDFGDASSLPGALDSRTAEEHFMPLRTTESGARYPHVRRPGSPLSDTDLWPPEVHGVPPTETPRQSSSFKTWLSGGIMDALGTAAGVTLSTTGRLVTPPLQMTKALLLPGLLALIVDMFDAITPPRVQDWFRIISSSVYHLMVVLGNTEKGQIFSSQVYIVLQDILQAMSAPESRQVLVDGMASSVKFADALHTPEMMEFLEQLSTLGIRLLDAASSGKAKQLMQDTKDMAWKGIEMATDPATTLALAEVTAHLCHALEDTQQALNPTPRKQRDAQNQAVYLNPYQMTDFPEQVTMEEVILSCLGRVEDNRREAMGDDGASLPSRLTLDDDFSTTEPEITDWKERKEKVNVELLKEKILSDEMTRSRVLDRPATIPVEDDSPTPKQGEERVMDANQPARVVDETDSERPQARNRIPDDDMEDIAWSRVPGARRMGLKQEDKLNDKSAEAVSAVQQFYQRLDELLDKDRERLEKQRAERGTTTINNSLEDDGKAKSWNARMKKLKQREKSRVFLSGRKARAGASRIPEKYHGIILVIVALGALLFTVFSGLALYGVYSLVKGYSVSSIGSARNTVSLSSEDQSIVIRIVQEVVHVTESGEVLGKSKPQTLTQEQLDKIGQRVADVLQ